MSSSGTTGATGGFTLTQLLKGSPVYPGGHWQMGLWLMTWHLALLPQVPGQGSAHFWLMQAVSWLQSELTTHSGLQLGGLPW